MTDIPIKFNADMVNALLEGRKTQTRRVLRDVPKNPRAIAEYNPRFDLWHWVSSGKEPWSMSPINLPYRVGDRLIPNTPRLTLVVTDVRIQRLQDISDEDAMAEGLKVWTDGAREPWFGPTVPLAGGPVGAFHALWDSIYSPDAWDENPWVVAVTFETHKCNIDDMNGDAE